MEAVKFVTEDGVIFPSTVLSDTEFEVSIAGFDDKKMRVYAALSPEIALGGFEMHAWKVIEYKVHLVPVNGAGANINAATVETQLNDYFKQGVVRFEVDKLNSISDTDPDGTIEGDKGTLTAYTSDMQRIMSTFDANNDFEPIEFYLFLTDNMEGATKGYMPEGLNRGFIDVNKGDAVKTMAHELGHGPFTLEHSWVDYSGFTQSSSQNLMDYGGSNQGTELWYRQWKRMHNPGIPLPWIQNEEDAQSVDLTDIAILENFKNEHSNPDINGTFTFLAPSGLPITLPKTLTAVSFNTGDNVGQTQNNCTVNYITYPVGSLRSFKYEKNGVEVNHTIAFNCSASSFSYYKEHGSQSAYVDTITPKFGTFDNHHSIIGYPCLSNNTVGFIVGKVDLSEFSDLNYSSIPSNAYKATGGFVPLDHFGDKTISYSIATTSSFSFQPQYEAEAEAFIKNLGADMICGSKASFYLFTHADQLNNYPGFYGICHENYESLTKQKILERAEVSYNNLYVYVDGGYPPIPTDKTVEDLFKIVEYNQWKSEDVTLYEKYYNYKNSLNQDFWTDIQDITQANAQTLFNKLYEWKSDPCALSTLTWEQREHTLRLLGEKLDFTEDNWYDSDLEEENIYNYVIAQAPQEDHGKILNFFQSNPTIYVRVASLMNDVHAFSSADTHGFDMFANLLFVYSQNAGHTFIDSYVAGIISPSSQDSYTYSYDLSTGTIDLGLKNFEIIIGQDGSTFKNYTPPHFNTGALSPFATVKMTFASTVQFNFGQSDPIVFQAGSSGEIPVFFLDYLYRKYDDSNFELGLRIAFDGVAILAGIFTGGAGTAALWVLRAGAVYGAVDYFVAHDQYEFEVYGSSAISQDVHQIWNMLGLAIGIADLSILIRQVGPKLLLIPSKARSFFKNIFKNYGKQKIAAFEDAIKQTIAKLQQQLDELPIDAPPQAITDLEFTIDYWNKILKGVQISKNFDFANGAVASIDNFGISISSNNKGQLTYLNAPFGDEFDIIQIANQTGVKPTASSVIPLNGDPPPGHSLLTTIENIPSEVDGLAQGRTFEVWHSPTQGTKWRIISIVDNLILTNNPGLMDFYQLFAAKGWTSYFDNFFNNADVINYFDNLEGSVRSGMKAMLANIDDAASSTADALKADILSDMASNGALRSTFETNPATINKWLDCFADAGKRIDVAWLDKLADGFGTSYIGKSNPPNVSMYTGVPGAPMSDLAFWNNVGDNCLFLTKGDYVFKYNYNTGKFVFGQISSSKILGYFEGPDNIAKLIYQMPPNQIFRKLKDYLGVNTPHAPIFNLGWTTITSKPGVTTTIVGKFTDYPYLSGPMKNIVDELLGGLNTQQFGPKNGGFNVLNVDGNLYDPATFWNLYNKPWLLRAIDDIDDIVAASDPMVLTNLFKSLDDVPTGDIDSPMALYNYLKNLDPTKPNELAIINQLSGYGDEVKLLADNDWIFDAINKKFVRLIDNVNNTILNNNPGLIDFYTLFSTKGWTSYFDNFFNNPNFINYVDNMPSAKRTELKNLLNNLDNSEQSLANGLRDDIISDIISSGGFRNFLNTKDNSFDAWLCLKSIADDIGVNWKTDIPTLTKLSEDITSNSDFKNFLINNSDHFDSWNEVIAASKIGSTLYRSSEDFIKNYKITKGAARLGDSNPGSFEKHILDGESNPNSNLGGLHSFDAVSEGAAISMTGPVSTNANGVVTIYSGPNPASAVNPVNGLHTAIEQGSQSGNAARVYVWKQHGNPPVYGWKVKKTSAANNHMNDFFPSSWSRQKIVEEIAFARSRLTMSNFDPSSNNTWIIPSSDGSVMIHMYIGPNNPTSVPSLTDLYGSAFAK